MLVLVGFMGAFTTFSAIMLESSELAKASGWLLASANVLAHNALGVLALLGGAALIKAT
jgi:CrcB protein